MIRVIQFILLFFLISCGSKKEVKNEKVGEKPTIAVVNYPLYYFAKSIAGEYATVYLPSLGGDPAYWKPSAKQVVNFQNSDLILANGAGYAKWMEKVSLPTSKIVNTSLGFKNQWIKTDETTIHSHGPEGEHSHKETAITTWLNFKFAKQQASAVYEAISKLLPENVNELNQNFVKLESKLDELDKKMESIALKIEDQYIVASHPVYQYLESGYGLNMISLHWEPNEMPDDEHWSNLSKIIDKHNVRVMIWEDNPLEEISTKLEKLNVKMMVFNPSANIPASSDFLDIMEKNLLSLEQIYDAM